MSKKLCVHCRFRPWTTHRDRLCVLCRMEMRYQTWVIRARKMDWVTPMGWSRHTDRQVDADKFRLRARRRNRKK